MLELRRYLIPNSLKLRPHFRRSFIGVPRQRVQVLLVPHFLLFFLNFERTDVLFQLSLVHSVVIFTVFELDLGFFLELSQLI